MLPPVEVLNELPAEEFRAALAPLFEGGPSLARELARSRPYGSYEELLNRAADVASNLPEEAQLELINSHPRLGADPRTVSELSFREQGYDGPAEATEVAAELERLNAEYERRFGFRFVVFVAGRPRREMVPLIEECLGARREEEKQRALRDIMAIARDRLPRLRAVEERR